MVLGTLPIAKMILDAWTSEDQVFNGSTSDMPSFRSLGISTNFPKKRRLSHSLPFIEGGMRFKVMAARRINSIKLSRADFVLDSNAENNSTEKPKDSSALHNSGGFRYQVLWGLRLNPFQSLLTLEMINFPPGRRIRRVSATNLNAFRR